MIEAMVVIGIDYRQVRVSIPREVCIQMVPSDGADVIIDEIDRDRAGLRCRDSSSSGSSSANHPFPAVAALLQIKTLAILFLCFHGIVGCAALSE